MVDISKYIIIEPHMLRLKKTMCEIECFPLGPAVFKDDDLRLVVDNIYNQNNHSAMLLVDLYPYRLGPGRIEALAHAFRDKKVYFILRKGSFDFEDEPRSYDLPWVLLDKDFNPANGLALSFKNYIEFKLRYIENRILQWVKEAVICPKNNQFITLQDGTRANIWIDIKGILQDPEKSFYIAYQIGYLLSKGFTIFELKEVDGFIVANNNALPIASLLSIFFAKSLFIVDKLGPSPRVNPKWLIEMKDKLEGKRLIIIEDVISTGREVDLLYFFLIYHRVEVKKIISVIDLQCAKPVLAKQNIILSLCRPSESLRYKRILAYQGDSDED